MYCHPYSNLSLRLRVKKFSILYSDQQKNQGNGAMVTWFQWVLNDDKVRKALARSFGTSPDPTVAKGSRFTEDVREYAVG